MEVEQQSRNGDPLIGFFVKPYTAWIESCKVMRNPSFAQFVYTCREGKDLKKGRWGNLDESLSFLGQEVFVVSSSNGFLLCCSSQLGNVDYIVCNPVTREFRRLPRPHNFYFLVATAFICKGTAASLDEVCYEVVRARVQDRCTYIGALEIETFSSDTNSWTEASIVSDSPFAFRNMNIPAFVVEQVIFWRIISNNVLNTLLAYDRATQRVELIKKEPGDGQGFVICGDCFGQSEGKIHYARYNYSYDLEVWDLEDYRRGEWVLKHRMSLSGMIRNSSLEMARQGPEFFRPEFFRAEFVIYGFLNRSRLLGFHPRNSQLVLLTVFEKPFWYDMANRKFTEIGGFSHRYFSLSYFPYEWPVACTDDYRDLQDERVPSPDTSQAYCTDFLGIRQLISKICCFSLDRLRQVISKICCCRNIKLTALTF